LAGQELVERLSFAAPPFSITRKGKSIMINVDAQNDAFKAGLKVRRQVLGDAYVDKSLAAADAFSEPLQQFVTEHAWGNVWLRPGLSLKQRSMVNLGILIASNRPHELKIHLLGALNNGVTKEEMVEIFLQCGVYCGAPSAMDAFKIAREVFAEVEAAKSKA
jgi:4-carboxymuconolactone decarboxylase